MGHKVTFACNDWQRQYILVTFPDIDTIHLDGYNVTYNSSGNLLGSLLLQTPRILKTIRQEQQWLLSLTGSRQFNGIISDNRYGLYHPKVPSVIITHQLQVQTGLGDFSDNVTRKMHYKLLSKFSECWVADVPSSPNLSGKLSHPAVLPKNAVFTGLLSQLNPKGVGSNDHLLVLLSGPEPQRTILSGILWQQVQDYSSKVIFIEGSNDVETPDNIPAHISHYKRVARAELLPLLANASLVVCRSGYSSVMDLVALSKNAILIPTPGQTEQEYLAMYLHNNGMFYSMQQKGFNLKSAMDAAQSFPFKKPLNGDSFSLYKAVVANWIEKL